MSDNKILDDLKKYSLSNFDIQELLKGKANLLTYLELKEYDNIDDVLGKYGACVILYLSSLNYGHWCCIFRSPKKNTLEYFDPYGYTVDYALKFAPEHFRKVNGLEYPHLTYLLYNSPYNIEYNNYKFQKLGNGINTCGRHVVTRLLLRYLTIEQYNKLMKKYKNIKPDDFVTIITENKK